MASRSVAITDRTGVPTASGKLMRSGFARLVETADAAASDTYIADFFIPAYAVIVDVITCAEALWDDGTAATLEAGMYADSSGTIGSALDADGWQAAIDLKATDLLANESLSFAQGGAAADIGAYADGTATHILNRISASDRWLRFKATVTAGDGTAGRTVVGVVYAAPELKEITATSLL